MTNIPAVPARSENWERNPDPEVGLPMWRRFRYLAKERAQFDNKTIAKICGVAPTTVNNILNNVSEKGSKKQNRTVKPMIRELLSSVVGIPKSINVIVWTQRFETFEEFISFINDRTKTLFTRSGKRFEDLVSTNLLDKVRLTCTPGLFASSEFRMLFQENSIDHLDLVGREELREALKDHLDDVSTGPKIAYLQGPPGVGKTALAADWWR